MATQLAERTADPVTVFRQTLATPAMREQIKMALPSHIPPERFERVCLTAVQQNPDLLNPQKVERRSLFGALVRAAQDGLLPDGREGAIVPFRGKAQWMPMVNGIMTKVRRSGEIASWEAAAVYEKDQFERLLGDDQRIFHKPFEDGDPGEVVGAYSIVTFKDGTKSRDYMPRWRIEKAREQNPLGKNSLMWTKFYDEGAIKTVIRHHSKRLPMSTDVEAIFERDETMTPPNGYAAAREVDPDAPAPTRLDLIESQIGEGNNSVSEPPVEPEVITEQAEELEAEIEQPDEANSNSVGTERDASDTNSAAPESTPAEEAVEKVIAAMDSAKKPEALEKIIADAEKHKAFMPDDLAVKLEIAADRNRKRLEPATEGETVG